MLAFLVERRGVIKIIHLTINPHPAETLAVKFRQLLAIFALAAAHDRCQQIDPRPILHGQQDINHLADGLAANRQTCSR